MPKRASNLPFELLAREVEEWVEQEESLVELAAKVRSRGIHHSDFRVGASALIRKSGGSTLQANGWNNKPNKGSGAPPRRCAEEHILDQAAASWQLVIGFVVVAPHQPDDFSGVDYGVTLPCGFCRDNQFAPLIAKQKLIIPETRIICVNAFDTTKRVKLTVEELLRICEDHSHKS